MFWSHDLLGKKTALGAVWIVAHGKKLNRGRIMQVDVTEACKKVMDPEVPQALRLQAILVGGIVIVHARQQVYLLEDAQEALRKLRDLEGKGEGGGAAARTTLGEGNAAAREEAITLPLNGDLHHFNLEGLFPAFPTASEDGTGRCSHQLEEGLFVMPSLPDGLSQGTALGAGGASKGRHGKGRRDMAAAAASGEVQSRDADRAGACGIGGGLLLEAGLEQEEEVEVNLEGLPRHDLDLLAGEELFAVPDIDMLAMPFMTMGAGAPAEAAAAEAAAGIDYIGREEGMPPLMPDDKMPMPEGVGSEAPSVPGAQQNSTERSDGSKACKGSTGAGEVGGGKRHGRRGQHDGGRKRGHLVLVDDIDTLQIRGRDYREWMADRSTLLVVRPQRLATTQPPAGGASAAASVATKSALVVVPHAALPLALLELFMRNATLPKVATGSHAKKTKSGTTAAAEEEPGKEQDRHLEERAGPLPLDGGGAFVGLEGMGDGGAYGSYRGMDGMGMDGLLPEALRGQDSEEEEGAGGGNPFQRRMRRQQWEQERESQLGSEDEEMDVETERLRAALNSTQGTDPYYLQQLGLTPASADPARPASAAATGRGARGTKRGSGLLRRDSESGTLSEKSSERRDGSRLSDLMEGGGGGPGGEDLGAMLPAVVEDEPFLDEDGGEEQEGGSRKRHRTGDTGATDGTLSQFELLEASGPTQELGVMGGGGGPHGDGVQKQTVAFIGVMRGRLDAAESRLAEEGGGGGGEAAACHLSFFGLAAKLSRMDAAKLFYQTLQARSHGFLATHQEEPYGDILLTRGTFL